MFTDASALFLILGGIAVFLSGFVKGFAGFGFSVAFTPALLLLFGHPHEVVFYAIFLGTVLSIGVITEVRHALRASTAVPILAGTVIGTPIGIAILGVMDVQVLKLTIAGAAILATLLRVVKFPLKIRGGATPLAIGGFLGGLLNGCTSMGGPAAALVVGLQEREVHESRAILVTFNLLSYFLALVVALGSGVAEPSWLISGVWLLPLAAMGSICGIWTAQRAPKHAFSHFITGVIGLSGIAGLTSILVQ